jgi:predicted DNA-binding protein with PD1-like motif
MDVQLLNDTDQLRTFAVVFAAGDEVSAGLLTFARRERISGASFTAIGALERESPPLSNATYQAISPFRSA